MTKRLEFLKEKYDKKTEPRHICNLLVGTSGYSYTEWSDTGFYPVGTKSNEMLSIYSGMFSITELNYTWYQMPISHALERMRQRVTTDFYFAAKLNRNLTHEINPDLWRDHAAQYRDGLAPLVQTGQLAAILVQLPPSFRRVPENRRYLGSLLDVFYDLPVAVEFRHVSWAVDSVFAELEQRKVTLVAVDEPELPGLFPKLDIVTNPDFFYIRFHGRNSTGWYSGNMQKQFDYDYKDDELHEWLDLRIRKMADQARNGIIFFNNHVRAQAPKNAQKLIMLLGEKKML